MDASDKSARPSGADSKDHWVGTGYWPIAFAVAGCAVAIALAFEAKDLSNRRSVLDRGRPAREKIIAENLLTPHALIDLRSELKSIETKEKSHQQILSIAHHEIEKAQRDKETATQETDKVVKEEPKADFDRAAAEKRIQAVRGQFEDGQKRLSILKDKFMHGQVRLASLVDRRTKLKPALPEMVIDRTRLQGAQKLLEHQIQSTTKQRDAVAYEIERAQGQLHQSQHSRAGQARGLDGFRRLADDLRKQSEHARNDIAELERKRVALALPAKVSTPTPTPTPVAVESDQEERRAAELRSQDAELDAKRIELEQNVTTLQQRKEELEKTNKSFQDKLDAAASNLASIVEQVKALEPDRREALALQSQLEELNRQIDERQKMIDHPVRPAPRSRSAHPVPLGATDQPPRGTR